MSGTETFVFLNPRFMIDPLSKRLLKMRLSLNLRINSIRECVIMPLRSKKSRIVNAFVEGFRINSFNLDITVLISPIFARFNRWTRWFANRLCLY